nr:hypothetical protein [uncultured Agathobaculum sp.]
MKPILFNTGMIRAILEDRKTVTRRVVKFNKGQNPKWTGYVPDGDVLYGSNNMPAAKSPFRKDDVLWVRETFAQPAKHTFWYKADFKLQNILWRPSIHMPREAARLFLMVTSVRVERLQAITEDDAEAEGAEKMYPYTDPETGETAFLLHQNGTFRAGFSQIWDNTIKSADRTTCGWEANPWVWVIEFEQISKEEAINGA